MNYFWSGLVNPNWGARAGKYKLSARAGKYKLGAGTSKYKLGARAGGRETQRPVDRYQEKEV